MMVSGIPQQEVRPHLTCTVLLARNLLCAGLLSGSLILRVEVFSGQSGTGSGGTMLAML